MKKREEKGEKREIGSKRRIQRERKTRSRRGKQGQREETEKEAEVEVEAALRPCRPFHVLPLQVPNKLVETGYELGLRSVSAWSLLSLFPTHPPSVCLHSLSLSASYQSRS